MPTPEELFEHWTPWAKKIAQDIEAALPKFRLLPKQLETAALLGLWQACNKFEAGRGWKFVTFARGRIRGEVYDEVRRSDFLPKSHRAESTAPEAVPLQDFMTSHLDKVYDKGFAQADLKRDVELLLSRVSKRQRQVLTMYYFENLSLKEIGKRIGVSESRVCQLLRFAKDEFAARFHR